MMKHKGYWRSEHEINQLFDFESQSNSRVHADVQKKIQEIKNRNISS